ncbi:phosphoribosylformylglycinamidine cyclo-ligase, partial [candidate division KSB1 bacterium]
MKLLTNKFESDLSVNDRRIVNIDPGYISEASLILASTKNYSHRIYLSDGIFADCHLIFEGEEFNSMPWTYPDYKEGWIRKYFSDVRQEYFMQLQSEKAEAYKSRVTYRDAGVDIDEGDKAVERIKVMVRSTYGDNVLSDLGKFGGFFAPDFNKYDDPVLVSSVDGVGTKLKIAFMTGIHNTVGSDLVNHCINDVLCCGAKPMFFLDYLAFGKLEVDVFEKVVSGLANACEESSTALIGGETAEMPGFYREGEYDISGTIVGIVDRGKILDGSKITSGDIILGLPSTGLHTNGYSLARKIVFEKAGLGVDSRIPDLKGTVGEELLKVHKCYFNDIYGILERDLVHGLAHITGGGLLGNISRLLSGNLKVEINWDSWDRLPVFDILQRFGNVPEDEMRHVFNLGIGLAIITDESKAQDVKRIISDNGINVKEIGKIVHK